MKTYALVDTRQGEVRRVQQFDADPNLAPKWRAGDLTWHLVAGDAVPPPAQLSQTVRTEVAVIDGQARWLHTMVAADQQTIDARANEAVDAALAQAGGAGVLIARLARAAMPAGELEQAPWQALLAAVDARAARPRLEQTGNPGGRD